MKEKIDNKYLVEIVRKIQNSIGTEEEIDEMIEFITKNVPCPNFTDLIFWDKKKRSPEEIVDIMLSYQPITLPFPPQKNCEKMKD